MFILCMRWTTRICSCCFLFLLFFLYVFVDQSSLKEGLRNYEDPNSVQYTTMHDKLTNYVETDDISNSIQDPPYSYEDFSANLDESETEKDFKYFNNASAITAGHSIYQVS